MKYLSTLLLLLLSSCEENRPLNLGVKEGKLQLCLPSTKCVTSQAPQLEEEQKADPLPFHGSKDQVKEKIKKILATMEGAKIIQEEPNYLSVEFTSTLLKVVDDMEFYFDEKQQLIHLRSESRKSSLDFGANRKRVQQIIFEYMQM